MFYVAEKFISINGEGIRAGEASVFIRFKKCNLNCSYCDTKWANEKDTLAEAMTAEEITEFADESGITNVTLTGGEPLLQKDIGVLCGMLANSKHTVEIETNGSIFIGELALMKNRPFFTLDYKLPSSGCESFMNTENYKFLSRGDVVKFVVSDETDLKKAKEITEKYSLDKKCTVFLSPVFGKIEPRKMVEFLLENKMNGVKIQLQLHKYIWEPDRRGV